MRMADGVIGQEHTWVWSYEEDLPMFKKMLSVVAVLALSGIVYGAGNVKTSIDAFAAVNGENATADGRAMFHYKSSDNETSVQLMLDDFTPNTVYDIQYVSGTMGEAAGCDVITTDGQGRAHYRPPCQVIGPMRRF